MQPNGRDSHVPATITLRECSVVIVGSTCRICGRDFKCESDVDLHTRWRHNAAIGSLMDIVDRSETKLGDTSQKCDMCNMIFGIDSDLRVHKRLIHKHVVRNRRKRRREMVRVKFKLNGVTTTDVSIDRRYIELPNSLRCFVDVCTQTSNSLKNERHYDCSENIDLSLPNHVVHESHIQDDIRPHEAANRYIVSKFASTKGDAIASRTVVVGQSLVKISNTSHKAAIPDKDGTCEENKDRCCLSSQEAMTDVFIKTFSDSIDIHDKENSRRTNELERKNIYCQSKISLSDDDTEVFLACQSKMFNKPLLKQNQSSECPRYSIKRSDEIVEAKKTGLTNSLINSLIDVEIISNDGKNYDLEGNAMKYLSSPLSRFNKTTNKSVKANSNVDDDVQEVLRITRGNTQNDINHESPNRLEREMLVKNDTLPSQLEPSVCPKKCNVAFTNFEPSDYSSFMAVNESDYQFLSHSFDKKLGIYLENLHHYGIRLYDDLPEINNNLEEYWLYAPSVYPRDTQ